MVFKNVIFIPIAKKVLSFTVYFFIGIIRMVIILAHKPIIIIANDSPIIATFNLLN